MALLRNPFVIVDVLDLANYTFNPYALPTVAVAIGMFLLGLAVLRRERGSPISVIFLGLTSTITIWLFNFSWMYFADSHAIALFWARMAYLGVPFIPAAVYHFSVVGLRQYSARRHLVWAGWLLAAVFSGLLVGTDVIFDSLHRYWWGFYPAYKRLPSAIYLTYFCGYLVLGWREQWVQIQQLERGIDRRRSQAFLLAFSIAYIGVVDYFAAFGIPVYPFGYLPIFCFLLLIARAVKQYRLVQYTPEFAAERVLTIMADPLIVCNPEGRIQLVNEAACKILIYSEEELLGRHFNSLIRDARLSFEDILLRREVRREELVFSSKTGTRIDVSVSVSRLHDRNGKPAGTVILARDVRERLKAERALRESEERYALAARGANDGLWDWDLTTDEIYFSPRWKEMLGYEEDDIVNEPTEWFNRVHPDDIAQLDAELDAHIAGVSSHFESEHRMLHADGTYRWMLCRGLAVRDDAGTAYRMAGSQTDITDTKRFEQQLMHDALHDALTNLPNRALLMDRLSLAVERAKRHTAYVFAVLFLDVDRFKVVNDSLGHIVGDKLLVEIARRLQTCVRPTDLVARLGGDEFVILLDGIDDLIDATSVAQRVKQTLIEPFKLHRHEVIMTTSIGIVTSAIRYNRAEDVLRDADIAMYRAKALGKSQYVVFDKQMRERAHARLHVELDLRQALANDELRVVYQPINDLKTGATVGFEALVRWEHPERGLIAPVEFIPLAEETGLILPMSEWIIREACTSLKEWNEQYPFDSHRTMSVNVSYRQISQSKLVKQTKNILDEVGLDPRCLNIELTENVLMEDVGAARTTLEQLREAGISVSIDDFGTGYSSLGYLQRFPVDAIKIDRSFVYGVRHNQSSAGIIRAIVTLAKSLQMTVIAEGVESADQCIALQQLDCDFAQGFFFSKPLRKAEVAELLAQPRIEQNAGYEFIYSLDE